MSNTSRAETKLKKDSKKKGKEEIGKLSPTHSEIEEPITFKPIDGEDIQALSIKHDDLKKIKKHRQNSEAKLNEISVRKKNPKSYPTVEVKVAKLVPDKPLKPLDLNEHLGIYFDQKDGSCLPHSILGTVDEYYKECEFRGNKNVQMPLEIVDDVPKADFYIKNKESGINEIDNGFNALNNWSKRMTERKTIQKSISKTLNRPLDDLVMNQADSARRFNEIKTLLDRALPLLEDGKGYRFGSEFYNQPFQIGSADNGLYTTLTESEKGNLPDIEQIMKPLVSIKESDFKENQPNVVHYPWDRSEYLQKRLNDLEPLIKEIIPHRPEFQELQVVGEKYEKSLTEDIKSIDLTSDSKKFIIDDTWVNPKVFDKDAENEFNDNNNHYLIDTSDDPFTNHPDIIQGPVFGPGIMFGGQMAKWTGNETENKGIIALESRLNFETKAGKRVLATFEIHNVGTTAIYYDWKKTDDFNPFEMNSTKVQRFYFDNRSSMILPGDYLKLNIVFKSLKGGIFTEKWEFITKPNLLNSASLLLTLRGVAVQDDKHKKNRAAIEKKLLNKEAELISAQMLDLILSGVRTPERCQSPQNAYLTEEDLFNELNPGFYYDYETVQWMKGLNEEVNLIHNDGHPGPGSNWSLSINDLKYSIMQLPENDPQKEENLACFNKEINNMCFKSYSPKYSKMYSVLYNMFCQTLDNVTVELGSLKKTFDLPIENSKDEYPQIDEFNSKYELWKRENELFKQAELERKNRLEALKAGKEAKEKGGKMTAGKKDDKTKGKDDKNKKSTPTPSAKKSDQRGTATRELTSRSASRNNQDTLHERSRTPRDNMTTLSDEEHKNKNLFNEKAYINIYQELCKMIDNMDTIFSEIILDTDVEERLSNLVFESSAPQIPVNSDYID